MRPPIARSGQGHLIIQELNKELPGRPRTPRAPRQPANREPKTESERYKQEADLRHYYNSLEEYERERRDFDSRLADWNRRDAQRRKDLQDQKAIVDKIVHVKDAALEEHKEKIKATVASMKEVVNPRAALKQSVRIASIASANARGKNVAFKFLAHAACNQLFDFSSESA